MLHLGLKANVIYSPYHSKGAAARLGRIAAYVEQHLSVFLSFPKYGFEIRIRISLALRRSVNHIVRLEIQIQHPRVFM
jgi:hypothetical protein